MSNKKKDKMELNLNTENVTRLVPILAEIVESLDRPTQDEIYKKLQDIPDVRCSKSELEVGLKYGMKLGLFQIQKEYTVNSAYAKTSTGPSDSISNQFNSLNSENQIDGMDIEKIVQRQREERKKGMAGKHGNGEKRRRKSSGRKRGEEQKSKDGAICQECKQLLKRFESQDAIEALKSFERAKSHDKGYHRRKNCDKSRTNSTTSIDSRSKKPDKKRKRSLSSEDHPVSHKPKLLIEEKSTEPEKLYQFSIV